MADENQEQQNQTLQPEQQPADVQPAAEKPTETAVAAPESQTDDPGDLVRAGILAGLRNAIGETPVEPKRSEQRVGRTLAEIAAAQAEAKPAEEPAAEETPAEPSEETTAAEEPPKEPAPAAPETPKVEVERRPSVDAIVEKTIKKTLESLPKPDNASPGKTATVPLPDPFEASLSEAEREELALARFAAEKDPKHKELPNQVLGYFKKASAKMEALLKENPDRTLDENDDEFVKWKRQNAPTLSPVERKRLERSYIEDSVAQRLRKEQESALEEVRREARLAQVLPQIKEETQAHVRKIEQELAKDPNSIAGQIIQEAAKAGWDDVVQQDRIFAPIVRTLQETSAHYAQEFQLIAKGLKRFDENDANHKWIYQFVQGNSEFVASDEKMRVRSGKTFLNRQEWNAAVAKDPSTAQRHWTFSDAEVLDMIRWNTKQNIEQALKSEQERLEKSGFVRQKPAPQPAGIPNKENPKPAAATPTPAPAPAQHVSPRSTVSAAPGAATASKPQPANPEASWVLSTLGVKR